METKIFVDFEIVEGKEKVMLSAPHPFIHMRDGNIRYAETNTDTLVKELVEERKAFGIYKTYSSDTDANWDEVSSYRDECIREIKRNKIKFLIDFHGMKSERDLDICLGTGHLKNLDGNEDLVNKFADIFRKHGFKNVSIDEPFSAGYQYTVSSHIHEACKIPALQIEISGRYRLPESEEFNLEGIKEAVNEIIDYVKKMK